MPWVWISRSRMPAARMAASSFSVFTLLAATAAVAVGALACVPTVMLASSGGVLNDSAMLTRTSGVVAISAMLAVGACWAAATAGKVSDADKAIAALTYLAPMNCPLDFAGRITRVGPETPVVRKSFEQREKNIRSQLGAKKKAPGFPAALFLGSMP